MGLEDQEVWTCSDCGAGCERFIPTPTPRGRASHKASPPLPPRLPGPRPPATLSRPEVPLRGLRCLPLRVSPESLPLVLLKSPPSEHPGVACPPRGPVRSSSRPSPAERLALVPRWAPHRTPAGETACPAPTVPCSREGPAVVRGWPPRGPQPLPRPPPPGRDPRDGCASGSIRVGKCRKVPSAVGKFDVPVE